MRKKNVPLFFVICLLAILIFSPFVQSGPPDNDVNKAKEYMSAGIYPQAIKLLINRIKAKPTDAEAHYQLGVCFISSGKYKEAKKSFSNALQLDNNYGSNIAVKYEKAGTEALKKGLPGMAKVMFKRAMDYQPNRQKEVARQLFESGKENLDKRQSTKADILFANAVRLDDSLKERIRSITTSYGKNLLIFAKDKSNEDRLKYIDEALKYISQSDVDMVFPLRK